MRADTFPAPWGVQTNTERSEVGANTPPLWRLSAYTGEVYYNSGDEVRLRWNSNKAATCIYSKRLKFFLFEQKSLKIFLKFQNAKRKILMSSAICDI